MNRTRQPWRWLAAAASLVAAHCGLTACAAAPTKYQITSKVLYRQPIINGTGTITEDGNLQFTLLDSLQCKQVIEETRCRLDGGQCRGEAKSQREEMVTCEQAVTSLIAGPPWQEPALRSVAVNGSNQATFSVNWSAYASMDDVALVLSEPPEELTHPWAICSETAQPFTWQPSDNDRTAMLDAIRRARNFQINEPEELTSEVRKAANQLFIAADSAKSRGDRLAQRGKMSQARRAYAEAVKGYLDAYKLTARPGFLYNLGQVYRLRGDPKEAILAYRKYIALDPDGSRVADARAYIEELELTLPPRPDQGATGDGRGNGSRARAKIPSACEVSEVDLIAAYEEEVGDDPPDDDVDVRIELGDSPEGQDSNAARYKRYGGLALGGVGVVLLGLGVSFGLEARRASQDVEREFDPVRLEEAQSARQRMFAMYATGAVALIGGGALYYLGWRDTLAPAGERSISIAPHVDHSSASVVVRGAF